MTQEHSSIFNEIGPTALSLEALRIFLCFRKHLEPGGLCLHRNVTVCKEIRLQLHAESSFECSAFIATSYGSEELKPRLFRTSRGTNIHKIGNNSQ